jgi:hypothetical protein
VAANKNDWAEDCTSAQADYRCGPGHYTSVMAGCRSGMVDCKNARCWNNLGDWCCSSALRAAQIPRRSRRAASPAPTADDWFHLYARFALVCSPDDWSFRNRTARGHDLSCCPVLPMSGNHCLRAAAHCCSLQRVAGFAKVRVVAVTSPKGSE